MMSAMSSLTALWGICQSRLPKQFVKLFQNSGQSSLGDAFKDTSNFKPIYYIVLYIINMSVLFDLW